MLSKAERGVIYERRNTSRWPEWSEVSMLLDTCDQLEAERDAALREVESLKTVLEQVDDEY